MSDARTDELKDWIDRYLKSESRSGAETVDRLSSEPKLFEAVDRYAERRRGLFQDLPDILSHDKPTYEWQSEIKEAREAAHSIFTDALNNTPTPSDASALIKDTIDEEDKFYDMLLVASSAPVAMEKIATYRQELAQQKDLLKAIWEKAAAQAEEINRSEDTVAKDIEDVIDEATRVVSIGLMKADEKALELASNDQAVNTVMTIVSGVSTVFFKVDLSPAVDVAVETAKVGAEFLKNYRAKIEVRAAELKKYLETDHASLLIMYSGARDLAKSFKQNHDYEDLKKWVEPALRALSDLKSNGTSGQKSDSSSLVDALQDKLQKAADAAQHDWEDFVAENAPKFFGPITPDVDKALLSSTRWDKHYSALASSNMRELLEKWIGSSRKLAAEIDQTAVPEAWKPGLRELLIQSLKDFSQTAEGILLTGSPGEIAIVEKLQHEALQKKLAEMG